MATALKRWLALTGAGLTIVALWTLPPSRVDFTRRAAPPEQERFDELSAEMRRAVGVLWAMRWSDSLSELTVRTAVDGLAFGTLGVDEEATEALSQWAEGLRAVMDGLQPRDESVLVGVFYQPIGLGQPADLPGPPVGGTNTYVGTRDGRSYCLQVYPVAVALTARDLAFATEWLPRTSIGACRLFAEYGLPGAQVRRWLDRGAMRFAAATRPPSAPPAPVDRSGGTADVLDPGVLFGMVRPYVVERNPTVGRCLAGADEACLGLMTSRVQIDRGNSSELAYIAANSPLTYVDQAGARLLFGSSDRYLLADVEAEFGPEAFSRFWTSDLDVPAAFEAAFGVSLGSWVRDWAQSDVGVYYAGPGLKPGSGLWSLLTLGLLASAACFVGVRRRVA